MSHCILRGRSTLKFRNSLLPPISLLDLLFDSVFFLMELIQAAVSCFDLAILGSLFCSQISSFLVGSYISRSNSICSVLLLQIRSLVRCTSNFITSLAPPQQALLKHFLEGLDANAIFCHLMFIFICIRQGSSVVYHSKHLVNLAFFLFDYHIPLHYVGVHQEAPKFAI